MSDTRKIFYFLYIIIAVLLFFYGPFLWGGKILLVILTVVLHFAVDFYIKQQEQQARTLRACEERYRSFLENSKDGIWRFELAEPMPVTLRDEEKIAWMYEKGYFVECNTAMAEMYGLKKEDILGKPLSLSLSKAMISDVMLKAFIHKRYCLRDVEVTTNDHSFIISLFGSICGQKLVSGWGSQKDITAAKKYSKEREKLLEETREAKNLAELASVEKDRVMANLSHELRTPLVSIIGYSEILTKDSDNLEKGLEIINRNAKAQLQLIEDLLTVSQATGGKVRLNKEKFNLKELIKYRVDSLKYKYEGKALEVITKGDDLEVFADQLKVGQIFTNLFSNAIKFTEKGSITVAWGIDAENSFFFSVEDTGIGIEAKNLKHLFTPYYQVDKGSSKSAAGVGLGLYIVKTFVNLHKGRVEVKSEVGKGTSFKINLPQNGNDLRILNKTLEGVHILLAEDDENVGEVAKLLLEREGTLVTWVKSAVEARKVLKQETFDLYLFDIAMPKEDGISLLKKLRDKGDMTPAVAVSAYADYESQCVHAGFNLFVLKPLSLDKMNELKSVIP